MPSLQIQHQQTSRDIIHPIEINLSVQNPTTVTPEAENPTTTIKGSAPQPENPLPQVTTHTKSTTTTFKPTLSPRKPAPSPEPIHNPKSPHPTSDRDNTLHPDPKKVPSKPETTESNKQEIALKQWLAGQINQYKRYPDRAIKKGIEEKILVNIQVKADGLIDTFDFMTPPVSVILKNETKRVLRKVQKGSQYCCLDSDMQVTLTIEYQLQ
ncbi:hypothetical protein [Gynuella sunshinyii]|uniref:Periplasmic protein TonB, links inner and outer membrane n=1 Tax=Gynuella sunshinyii YC6258 TaxID=1445510 RepID=A0A0C5VMA6_9GAMM|nr:hypothetical protein [Gynuella sunshinyii]AJQ94483.1 periplasmic protein TonB, links inner and outer membrane [Gynuella sunshinyii YC6258]